MSHLLNLPNEVLAHIFHFLDSPSPSSRRILAKPEYSLTFSTHQPLKSISLTSARLRFVVLPVLFRHARLDPYHLSPFLAFVAKSNTARHIESVAARLQGPCNHIHPAWWLRLLDSVPSLSTLTVLAAPHVFAEIGQVSIETSHSWAFKMPYHVMTLVRTPPLLVPPDEFNGSGDGAHINPTEESLLTSRSWTSLTINEASHLPAYSTYEYFLKVPPSLLASLYHRQHVQIESHSRLQRSSEPYLLPSTAEFLGNLASFSYIAIFPFYNHVDEILKCIRQMKKLKKLFLKLCPEPDSTVLQDELERNGESAGRTEGRIDAHDPWNEFETSYALIPHTVIYLTTDGSLEYFQTDDVKMVGVRDTLIEGIDRRLAALGCWVYSGNGIWQRNVDTKIESEGKESEQVESELCFLVKHIDGNR